MNLFIYINVHDINLFSLMMKRIIFVQIKIIDWTNCGQDAKCYDYVLTNRPCECVELISKNNKRGMEWLHIICDAICLYSDAKRW